MSFRRRWWQDARRKHGPRCKSWGYSDSGSMFFVGPLVFRRRRA